MVKLTSSLKCIAGAILLMNASTSLSQNYFYKTFTWEKQPTVYKPNEVEKQSELMLVKESTVVETAYDKDGQAVVYETKHRIYHVNSQKGIERINKVYISTNQVNEEIDIKARCITADNKIIPFNTDNVKRVDNLEDKGPYTIFSVDGVDVGCDVEYYFTNKHVFYPYAFYKIQNNLPIKEYNFSVLSPLNLIYETKSYNGLSQFVKDTTDKTKNILRMQQLNLPEVEEEEYASADANKFSFSVQLAYNTDKSSAKFYTWETIAKGYYNSLFVMEKNEQKLVDKLLDKNKIAKLATNEEKILALENLLKLEYNISNDNNDIPFNKSIDDKRLSETNAIRIYIAAFKAFNIPFELVLTSDRIKTKFDGKHPSYSFLNDILFYFPKTNKYTSPTEISSRLDYPNPNNTANEGLFIKEITIGDIGAPSSKIKPIPSNDYLKSFHNLIVKVTINANTLIATLDVVQTLMGYSAYYIQPVYGLLNDEQKKEVNKNYYTIAKPDLTKNVVVSNIDKEFILVKPFQIAYTQDLPDVIESAGDKFIFKVGELIGVQSELYQDKKRVSDGDIYFTHSLTRILEITIPDNYKITNADEIKIDKKCVIDGKDAAQFLSEYKIEGNKIIITAYEDYRVTKYPLVNFDGFKSVINAAADFNKKTLVFEKK